MAHTKRSIALLLVLFLVPLAIFFANILVMNEVVQYKYTPEKVKELQQLLRENHVPYILRKREITVSSDDSTKPKAVEQVWEAWVKGKGAEVVFVYSQGDAGVALYEGSLDRGPRKLPAVIGKELLREALLPEKVVFVRRMLDEAEDR